MDYSKFYTPTKIAETLISMMDIPTPINIIDICCGSCNLLKAAKKRWKNVRLWGVDLLPHESQSPSVSYFCMDGRRYSVECSDTYDLVLANPPFERMKNKCEYRTLYTDKFSSYTTSRLENEMLLANLKLLIEGGTLLIIMPSTFIEGDTNRNIRALIGRSYSIKKIIRLPIETFGASFIKSYALEIKNTTTARAKTKYYIIENKEEVTNINDGGIISQNNIREGRWQNETRQQATKSLTSYRGKISSNLFGEGEIPVLHTSKKQSKWRPSTRFTSKTDTRNVYVENNDILISRIGKSAGCWMKYYGNKMLVSDCLIVIKDSNDEVFHLINNKELFHLVKGVSTPYISLRDFENWYQTL